MNDNVTQTGNSTSSTSFNLWSLPDLIRVDEVGETIEMLYKEVSTVTYTVYPPQPPQERVFKIVYSCKEGKWHKSDRIYGEIIPASDEDYTFDQ